MGLIPHTDPKSYFCPIERKMCRWKVKEQHKGKTTKIYGNKRIKHDDPEGSSNNRIKKECTGASKVL